MCLFVSIWAPFIIFVLMLKFFLIWPVGAHSSWLLWSLDMSLFFFEQFLVFCLSRCSRLIWYIPCLSLGIRHFFSDCYHLHWKMIFRSQDLASGALIALWMSLLLGSLSGNTHTHIYVYECVYKYYIRIYIYIYIYFYKYIFWKLLVHISTSNFNLLLWFSLFPYLYLLSQTVIFFSFTDGLLRNILLNSLQFSGWRFF